MRQRPNQSASCLRQNHSWLFDHLVGAREEGFRDRHPNCLCGFEIDDQLEFSRTLDGQLTRFAPRRINIG